MSCCCWILDGVLWHAHVTPWNNKCTKSLLQERKREVGLWGHGLVLLWHSIISIEIRVNIGFSLF